MRHFAFWACAFVAIWWTVAGLAIERTDEFQVGGPLAGVKRPSLGNLEVELYPNAAERFRLGVGGMESHYGLFDKQSQLKNWITPQIPGCEGLPREQFPAKRKKLNRPQESIGLVDVVRCKVKAPVIKLDLGELGHGLYVVRIIAAGEVAKQKSPYEPLYIAMQVNDGLRGEVSRYRQACNFTDDFFSIAEFYFHAPERRRYQAQLWVDAGSVVEPLVHNITLDDVLAGSTRRAIKTRTTLTTTAERAKLFNPIKAEMTAAKMKFSPAERLARDEAIWNWLPPVNTQASLNFQPTFFAPAAVAAGADGNTSALTDWELPLFQELDPQAGFTFRRDGDFGETLLVNKKLNLKYTLSDLRSGKPLPGPYADLGNGLYWPKPGNREQFFAFAPIARAVAMRYRHGYAMCEGLGDAGAAKTWSITRNPEFARDAAINLIRYAYQFPTLDFGTYVDKVVGPRETRFTARETRAMWLDHYANYGNALKHYDYLFDYIRGNEELAQSVHRFIPWVKTSADVIELMDVYLVQQTAKRILRYHYYTQKTGIVTPALVLSDRTVTDPWMEWLFDRVLPYGMPVMGVQDTVINAYDRSGMHYIGSTSYAEMAGAEAMAVREYAVAVSDPRFDLTDPHRYPKPEASCYWPLAIRLGGLDFPRIGDVAGPDKGPNSFFERTKEAGRWGWTINHDPRFAWILKHAVGREQQSDDEWARIEAAAANVKRAPWLENHSRSIDNWFAALESGLAHDDYRFRRAGYIRVGQGSGHEHNDALDLQIISHGLPMTIDGGQRSGYSKPNDRHFARTHNTVEVDGQGHRGHSWAESLTDARGAAYVKVSATPPPGARLYARQLALIDISEGRGSRALTPPEQLLKSALPADIEPGSSYFFDVFRVAGGNSHAYCFHAMIDDQFQWNVTGEKPVPRVAANKDISTDANYLSLFEQSDNFAGSAPETLQATWRYSREPKFTGTEPIMLGTNYNPAAPRKFLRLNLNQTSGARAYRGQTVSIREGMDYRFTCVMTRVQGADLESAFAAVLEPYAGESQIVSQRSLSIPNNEIDAQRAVAVEVQLREGRRDICFADGRPDRVRSLGNLTVAGEFALLSTDSKGLRQVTLGGGTQLASPDVQLKTAARQRTALVEKVDYPQRTLYLRGNWSAFAGTSFEVGTPGHMTALTALAVQQSDNFTAITVRDAPDYLRVGVDPTNKPGTLTLRAMPVLKKLAGYDRNWVVSNDQVTRSWRADQITDNQVRINDASFSLGELGPKQILRLWEYGAGDSARHSTFVSLRRTGDNAFECTGDIDMTISLRARSLLVSSDQQNWRTVKTAALHPGWLTIAISAAQLGHQVRYLKIEPAAASR